MWEAGCVDNMQDEDSEWLSSLTEHELDFLISLKELATTKAKNIGRKDLSKKFDIKVLRALGFILLEYFKERVRNTPAISDADELLASLNNSGLSNLNCNRNHQTKPLH
ncbi:hypothetical protein HPP92_002534 [Vanilla planifolia]|uniref:Uncharacterized protein n=1 Tax=Vanilla planifolia TaxID=51239 RepID=A0A835VI23_VANPL|nr:hypothetical protein HPP92_002534 [Vanilla planifolia]